MKQQKKDRAIRAEALLAEYEGECIKRRLPVDTSLELFVRFICQTASSQDSWRRPLNELPIPTPWEHIT